MPAALSSYQKPLYVTAEPNGQESVVQVVYRPKIKRVASVVRVSPEVICEWSYGGPWVKLLAVFANLMLISAMILPTAALVYSDTHQMGIAPCWGASSALLWIVLMVVLRKSIDAKASRLLQMRRRRLMQIYGIAEGSCVGLPGQECSRMLLAEGDMLNGLPPKLE